MFEHWFSAARWCFNKAKEVQDLRSSNGDTELSRYNLRSFVLSQVPEWFADVPFLVKAGGVLDYVEARKNAILKFKTTGEFCGVNFRTKKKPTQSCVIKPESVTENGVYASISGKLKSSETLYTDGEAVLKRENGKYYLFATVKNTEKVTCENQARIVAIDPGIRTFATFYSGDICGKIGESDYARITRLCLSLDELISRRDKSRNHRERQALKKAIQRHRAKIRNLIDELHKKTALFLVRNFDVILLPQFETQQMSERLSRKITEKSVRSMLTFAHYRFKQYLNYKSREYGKQVIEVNEAYTSKTASWSGEIIENLGGKRYITSQGIVADRDINGARGIMLRALRASSVQVM